MTTLTHPTGADRVAARAIVAAARPVVLDALTLGRTLVVAEARVICDRHGHDLHVVTNGIRAAGDGAVPYGRNGTVVTFVCTRPTGRGSDPEPCYGYADLDLAAPDVWTSDPEAVEFLELHGARFDA